jgi:peroxiredoxin
MKVRSIVCAVAIVLGGAARATAQEDIGFKPIPDLEIVVPPFTDGEVGALLGTLDSLVARQTDPAKWGSDARLHLWRLLNRLHTGVLSAEQEARVIRHLDDLKAKHPMDAKLLGAYQDTVRTRMIGQVAPDIVGKDYDGQEFHLTDYRGQVVVVTFSGEWCGPCRGEYPYQRFLLEQYKDKPLTILSVNSDSSLDVAKKAKIDHALPYRSWWDGYGEKATAGPIASAWNVTGWPTIYVLDPKGVIRFFDLRQEDLLKGVKQLMNELQAKTASKQP